VIKKSEEIISELGATKTGPIYDKLLQMGVDHENYQIQAPSLEESRLIGSGAQNKVYQSGDQVEKWPHLGNSTSYGSRNGKMTKTQTTDLDKLIRQYEKILSIRIFNCVVNSYHDRFLHMNPEKASEVPIISSLNSFVDKNSIIKEDLVQDISNPVNRIEHEVAKFVPKIIKQLYFYFDVRGGVQAYKTGQNQGRPEYKIMDGVSVFKPKQNTQSEIEKHRHKFSRFDSPEKIAAQIDKFRSIVEKCSAEQTDILMQEIEHTFSI